MAKRKPQTWDEWLRQCIRDQKRAEPDDPFHPLRVPGDLAMLTGQDFRAIAAIDACWALYSNSDDAGRTGALWAIRILLPAVQEKCRPFARELIARHLDWHDREPIWQQLGELRFSVETRLRP